jgi:hypothetical protein
MMNLTHAAGTSNNSAVPPFALLRSPVQTGKKPQLPKFRSIYDAGMDVRGLGVCSDTLVATQDKKVRLPTLGRDILRVTFSAWCVVPM